MEPGNGTPARGKGSLRNRIARIPRQGGKTILRTFAISAGLCALAGVFAYSLLTRQPAEPVVPVSPVHVAGDTLRIPPRHAAWQYVAFEAATLAPALAPLPLPGRVQVDEGRMTRVMAPLAGRVDTVAVRQGQQVAVGDKLVSVRSSALVDLVTEEKLAQTGVSAQTRNLQRVKALVELQAAAQKDLAAAERAVTEAQLALDSAELKRKTLHISLDGNGTYWLLAQQTGVVVERTVTAGQDVGPDRTEPLLVIAQLDEVLAIGSVPESELGLLAPGQAAAVSQPSTPSVVHQGRIEWISRLVDAERHTVDVRIRLANGDGDLRPNAWVQVTFEPATTPRVVLPAEAVVTDEQRSVVFVRQADGSLEQRPVSVGRQRGGRVEVLTGVRPGDQVATRGALMLLNVLTLSR